MLNLHNIQTKLVVTLFFVFYLFMDTQIDKRTQHFNNTVQKYSNFECFNLDSILYTTKIEHRFRRVKFVRLSESQNIYITYTIHADFW